MTLYFISGLGADKRVFARLKLPSQFHIVHIDWIEPLKNESLKNYCTRLAAGINQAEDFILVGLSFGGIIAVELSKITKPKQTIIISSVAVRNELPWYYKLAGMLFLDRLVPASLLKRPSLLLLYWFFGARAKEDRRLLRQILADTAPAFLEWAIHNIVNWSNKVKPSNLYHIHGSADRVLPLKYTNANAVVKGGGHLIVWNKPGVVSDIITQAIIDG